MNGDMAHGIWFSQIATYSDNITFQITYEELAKFFEWNSTNAWILIQAYHIQLCIHSRWMSGCVWTVDAKNKGVKVRKSAQWYLVDVKQMNENNHKGRHWTRPPKNHCRALCVHVLIAIFIYLFIWRDEKYRNISSFITLYALLRILDRNFSGKYWAIQKRHTNNDDDIYSPNGYRRCHILSIGNSWNTYFYACPSSSPSIISVDSPETREKK